MGIVKLFSSCGTCPEDDFGRYYDPLPSTVPSGNPNPRNFTVKRFEKIGTCLLMEVHYPDCRNYEGNKIMVFEVQRFDEVLEAKTLDPHFCDSDTHPSPIARFEPTDRGWKMARQFCECV